jgi:polyferredoxin
MNVSYQEKLVWGQFLPMVVLYGYYFFRVARGGAGWSMVGVLIGIAVLQTVFSILVAALSKREPRDERDRLIEYKAFKVAYLFAVSFGVCGMWVLFMGRESVGRGMAVSCGLAFLVGVEMVRMVTLLVLHRTSVSV